MTANDERQQAARHVLWTLGHREHGYEPGGFTSALLDAWGRADSSNQARLRIAFPVYAHALDVLKHRGVDALLEWAGI